MRRSSITRGGVAIALALTLASCAVNPVTQERELSFVSLEEEKEIGARELKLIEEQVGLVRDEALVAYVRSIGARLAAHSPRKDVEYTFNVIDSDEINAFCTRGAYIYISRGLLSLVNSEDELAGVIGHEIGHAAALHTSVADWRGGVAQVMTGVGALTGMVVGGPFGAIGLGKLAASKGAKMVAAHSREAEEQADEIGQELAFQAGWDPARLGDFFRSSDRSITQSMKAVKVASAYDTHPMSVERIASAKARAEKLGKPSPGSTPTLDHAAFLAQLRGVVIGEDVRAGIFDKQNPTLFLHPELGFRIQFPEGWTAVDAPSFVFATDGPVGILLEVQGEGSDLKQASQQYFKQIERERAEAKAKKSKQDTAEKVKDEKSKDKSGFDLPYQVRRAGMRQVGKNRMAYVVEGRTDRNEITVFQHWISVPPNVYRVSCVIATQAMQAYLNDCRRTAGSLGPLRSKDRERAKQVTLDLAEALPDEKLEAFNERTHNQWGVEQTAAANALSLPYVLKQGQLVKYAHAQVYETPARSTPEEPEAPESPEDPGSSPEPDPGS